MKFLRHPIGAIRERTRGKELQLTWRIGTGATPHYREDHKATVSLMEGHLPVITQTSADSLGRPQIVRLQQQFTYDPLEGSKSGLRQIINRLQLHLSIGQAF